MPIYNYIQEAKIITWERTEFSIEAESQAAADERAKQFIKYDIDEDEEGVVIHNTAFDFNGNQLIPVEDNNGCPTVIVRRDESTAPLATNLPEGL